ncbi:nucleoside deaminase [Natronomonas halophila]|uniref:nucleoside deaminase n=1 Tax=Natronomonas halophila TaxID=2747817 RepID=UPI0015B738CA|nr:nucleoside deaminase [Natronomonas halophila]QLD86450.1 nucleoside deaminase [Natronomonas halophila]
MSEFETFDHEAHMGAAIDLAREAAERGDRPFGSVLVRDDEIVMRESNRVLTEDDIRRHPELHLAHRAMREMDPDTRAETVMYTSTEPCPMCSGGMRYAELDRVVYSVSAEEVVEFTGGEPATRASEILDCEVVGGVANGAGRAVHEEFW